MVLFQNEVFQKVGLYYTTYLRTLVFFRKSLSSKQQYMSKLIESTFVEKYLHVYWKIVMGYGIAFFEFVNMFIDFQSFKKFL